MKMTLVTAHLGAAFVIPIVTNTKSRNATKQSFPKTMQFCLELKQETNNML